MMLRFCVLVLLSFLAAPLAFAGSSAAFESSAEGSEYVLIRLDEGDRLLADDPAEEQTGEILIFDQLVALAGQELALEESLVASAATRDATTDVFQGRVRVVVASAAVTRGTSINVYEDRAVAVVDLEDVTALGGGYLAVPLNRVAWLGGVTL